MTNCKHELKLNEEEDFVFCSLCGKTWSKKLEKISYTPYVPYYTPPRYYGGLVTC